MELRSFLADCKRERWCTQLPCTTCGCRKFRSALESIETSSLIEGLGSLSADEYFEYYRTVQSVFKWLRYERMLFDPFDFEAINGSVVWRDYVAEYENFLKKRQKSGENREKAGIEAQQNRARRAEKASNDLPNAVSRGDIKAIHALLLKGADPDFVRGTGMDTARKIAQRLGKEAEYFHADFDDIG